MDHFMKEFEHLIIQLKEITSATHNFDPTKVIGSGGFGKVYEGEVSHFKGRSLVAIKRLDRHFGQGDPEFWKEIMLLSRYSHENLILLLGFCDENGEKILVYEHASNGSLDCHLSSTALTWSQRIKICVDAARGLSYLHDYRGSQQRVLHRDIKSANILLDDKWNAKVADMGLSKLGPANQPHTAIVTNIVGTMGYLDPMYLQMGVLTKESDVYSFGVVLMEVLCGKLCVQKNIDGTFLTLVPTWKKSYKEGQLDEIIFHDMMQPIDPKSLQIISDIAFQCLNKYREGRPSMSLVVKELEIALEFQEPHDLKVAVSKLQKEYEEILNAVVCHIDYESLEGLIKRLSQGVFLNGGQTWFYLNYKREHCVLISIAECLIPFEEEDISPRFSSRYNSRFEVGCYSTHGKEFKTRVRSQFLSRGTKYSVNLVFKSSGRIRTQTSRYRPLEYKLKEVEKRYWVYIEGRRKEEWLIARLHQFISDGGTVDLEFQLLEQHYWNHSLEIEGIEFQPLDDVEYHEGLELGYEKLLKSAEASLVDRSVEEMNALLYEGFLLNDQNTWFSLNYKGEHCVLISVGQFLNPECGAVPSNKHNSRFPCYYESTDINKTRVRTRLLSPNVTYTVNFVFKFTYDVSITQKLHQVHFCYKLNMEEETCIKFLAYKREDDWWAVELYQFTYYGTVVDLEVIFESIDQCVVAEGIEFRPLDKVEEPQVSHYQNLLDMQQPPVSDSDDAYWEQKLPNNYQDIIKLATDVRVKFMTKKELCSVLCKGFPISDGQEWLSLDKNGKSCVMISARAVFKFDQTKYASWQSLPKSESRFGEALVANYYFWGSNILNFNKSKVLSPQTKYGSFIVYKLLNGPLNAAPMKVRDEDLGSKDWNEDEYWYFYFVSPETPIIRPKVNQNTHNPQNRPKLKGIPQQRGDGWMEVQVYEFQTDTVMGVIPYLEFRRSDKYVSEIIMQGIELRPI